MNSCREIIKIQVAAELRPDELFQHLARTRFRNVEDTESRRRDAPDPVFLAVVFDAGLIAAELLLSRNRFGQFVIGG